jgi:hypothetical protein
MVARSSKMLGMKTEYPPSKEHTIVNRPRNIGTAAETAVVKVLRPYWPSADRSPLRGSRDQGDIRGTGDFIWEVKGGSAAKGTASIGETAAGLITEWLRQTEVERGHAGVRFGILVTTRRGVGATNACRWWGWLSVAALADITGAPGHTNPAPVRLELGALLDLLADQGFTDG